MFNLFKNNNKINIPKPINPSKKITHNITHLYHINKTTTYTINPKY